MFDPLMFSFFAVLVLGPLTFAIFGSAANSRILRFPLLNLFLTLLLTHTLFVGLFMISLRRDSVLVYGSFGWAPGIDNLYMAQVVLGFFWIIVLLGLNTLGLRLLALRRTESWWTSWKGALISTLISSGLLYLVFLPVSELSLLYPERTKEWTGTFPSKSAQVYFLKENQILKLSLTDGLVTEVGKTSVPDPNLVLVPREGADKDYWDIWVSRGETPIERLVDVRVEDSLLRQDPLHQLTLIGYGESGMIHTGPAFVVSTPFMRWRNGRENMYVEGEIIFELGGEIYYFSSKSEKLAHLTSGRHPLLVVEKIKSN